MNKLYVTAPLVGLALFGAVYGKYSREYDARLADIKRREAVAKQVRADQQAAVQAQAQAEAKATMERHKQEKAEKERLEESRRQARLDADQDRTAAGDEERGLRAARERLRTEVETLRDTVARNEQRKRELEQERSFIRTYVQQAVANQQALHQVLEKLETVERARAVVIATAPSPKPRR
jgi:chromosome segregation ATPase